MAPDVVAIGGSSGSLEALALLLPPLTTNRRVAVVVVLHRHRESRNELIDVLARSSALPVNAIIDGEPVAHGRVHVCPADYHVLVERDATFALSIDAPVNHARPSIDVLFESAAQCFGKRLVAVLLSGNSQDGARGLARVGAHGGKLACQDPSSARTSTMPLAGCAAASVDWIATPDVIGREIARVCA